MAKRSPILGYNHNVRYRGLVFHVQTEDSGMLSPHLFTHLFHGGVIISTRKLVYDPGSNEDAIKSLMQAQHKAVMKDLRRGAFDDKIDAYLGNTEGLEARSAPGGRPDRAPTEVAPPLVIEEDDSAPIEILNDGLSEPIELPMKRTPVSVDAQAAPVQSRTQTGDKTTRVDSRAQPPPRGGDVAAAVNAANAGARPPPKPELSRAPTQLQAKPVAEPLEPPTRDSSPVIEMTVDDDDDEISERMRGPRDTAVEMAAQDEHRDSPPAIPRPASHGAAALPGKPAARPVAPPMVTTRSAGGKPRGNDESQPIEIHAPAPPGAEPPPGERSERPGQYSVNRKDGTAQPMKEKTGRIPAIHPVAAKPAANAANAAKRGAGPNPVVPKPDPGARPGAPNPPRDSNRVGGVIRNDPAHVQRPPTPPSGSRVPGPAQPSRVPGPAQPSRVHATAPIANRTPSPATPAPGSGVVMTRPAVIVGAPPKPAAPQQRVRKAREEEGRFGQGLISEKSLDEVILAYLSEDAEDK